MTTPTFRLFVSSTFSDMKAEREILQAMGGARSRAASATEIGILSIISATVTSKILSLNCHEHNISYG